MSRKGTTNNWTPEECRNNIFSILRSTNLGVGLPNGIFNNIIGLKLRQKRLELKLTQSRVGSKLNVTFQQIQKYERGLNSISLNNLWKFCILYNVDINWFFEDIKDQESNVVY